MTEIGISLIGIAMIFSIVTTIHFGCNWRPSCKQEQLLDHIALFVAGLGAIIFLIGAPQ